LVLLNSPFSFSPKLVSENGPSRYEVKCQLSVGIWVVPRFFVLYGVYNSI